MSFTDSGLEPALTTQSDVRVLGQTGQTVVYMFPDGRGLAEREQPDFEALATPANSVETAEQTLDELVEAGKITPAQKAVILHDQAMTDMNLDEILVARGWA